MNLRPSAPKADALPSCATPRRCSGAHCAAGGLVRIALADVLDRALRVRPERPHRLPGAVVL